MSHGYVGADLKSLCRESALAALDRWQREHPNNWRDMLTRDEGGAMTSPVGLEITLQDCQTALSLVKPSAMRSLVIDVPKVSWTDIGGQEEVKQKLKEAVEWPLMVSRSDTVNQVTIRAR